jgi:hypothetical protein
MPMQVVEKRPIAALLQKVQNLTYAWIRFDFELFLRLALLHFSKTCKLDLIRRFVRELQALESRWSNSLGLNPAPLPTIRIIL